MIKLNYTFIYSSAYVVCVGVVFYLAGVVCRTRVRERSESSTDDQRIPSSCEVYRL